MKRLRRVPEFCRDQDALLDERPIHPESARWFGRMRSWTPLRRVTLGKHGGSHQRQSSHGDRFQ